MARRAARTLLPFGWPLYVLLPLYGVWWALGAEILVYPVVAIPMIFWLLRQPKIRAPKGFGIWLLFLLWMTVSAVSLTEPQRMAAWVYRGGLYFTAAVVGLYVFNLPRDRMPTRRLVLLVTSFWGVVVLGGFLGLLLPNVDWTSPMEVLLPGAIAKNPFVASLVHPGFSDTTTLLGYSIARPRGPFNYTNEWGSNLALLTPIAIYALYFLRSRLTKVLLTVALAASLVPIIISINRGLWLSLSLGVVYVLGRIALRGNTRVLAGSLGGVAVVAILILFTPLGKVVTDRFAHSNTEGRADLYSQAGDAALASPVLGYGAPQENLDNPSAPSVGTHGQLWTLLVSHGIPGVILFVAYFAFVLLITWRTSLAGLWPQSVLVIGLIQLPFYNMLPMQLHLMMIAVALAWRDVESKRWSRLARRDRGSPVPPALPSPQPAGVREPVPL